MARRPNDGHDASRREFFRTFSRQTVQNAGAVVGAAAELRRTSLAAARELLDLTPLDDGLDQRRTVATPADPPAAADETFRSSYRFTGDSIIVLDQRELPGRVLTFNCTDEHEAAAAIRSGAVTAGPVLADIGAYAMVLALGADAERPVAAREQHVRAAAGALRAARREVRALGAAVDRMEARYDALLGEGMTGVELRAALAHEADSLVSESLVAQSEMARRLSGWLRARADGAGRIDVLMHGDLGPLTSGMIGAGTAALQSLLQDGAALHVWVTDAQPSSEGTRIAAYSLSQADIPHTVIPDTAVAWLMANRELGAVLLRGDTVAQDGAALALIGARSVAQLAHAGAVPVVVLAPAAAHDQGTDDASLLTLSLRSAAEFGGARRARLNPGYDIVPGALVTAVISERGASS